MLKDTTKLTYREVSLLEGGVAEPHFYIPYATWGSACVLKFVNLTNDMLCVILFCIGSL